MLKTLLKKQLLELNKNIFFDSKKGRQRSKRQVITLIVVYVFVFYVLLGGATFGSMAFGLASSMVNSGHSWMYFLLMTGITLIMGVIGSVFSTYSSLYLSSDNDLLLSLPIPIKHILLSRLAGVYLTGLLFASIVMIPTLVVYYIMTPASLATVLCPIILALNSTFFIFILSVALGWVVARISLKVRNKSLVTTIVALVFLVGYYYFYIKAMNNIQAILESLNEFAANRPTGFAAVLYHIGAAGAGNVKSTLLVTAAVIVILLLVYILLDKTFIRIVTTKTGAAKVVYKEKQAHERSAFKALLFKETKHLVSSSTYMLNSAMGTLLMPAAAVFIIIKAQMVRALAQQLFSSVPGLIAPLFVGAVTMLLSMNTISTPSVSLEGKNLWISKTLPVTSLQILRAKMFNHLMFTLPPALLLTISLCIAASLSILETVLVLICAFSSSLVTAQFGLFLNLKRPNFNWTSEVVVIKQSLSIMIYMFSVWALSALQIVSALFLSSRIGGTTVLVSWTVIMTALALLLNRWLRKTGVRIMDNL